MKNVFVSINDPRETQTWQAGCRAFVEYLNSLLPYYVFFSSFLIIILHLFFFLQLYSAICSGPFSLNSEWWESKTKQKTKAIRNCYFYKQKEVGRGRIIVNCYTYRERMAHTVFCMLIGSLKVKMDRPTSSSCFYFFGRTKGNT
jgi:hypothetical protein